MTTRDPMGEALDRLAERAAPGASLTAEVMRRVRAVARTPSEPSPRSAAVRRRGVGPSRRLLAPLLATAATAACLVMAAALALGPAAPTWAQVTERFASVRAFGLTLYHRRDALAEAEPVELWVGEGGHARIRAGGQVVFGLRGQVVRAFDIERRGAAEAAPSAVRLLHALGDREAFSLETIVEAFRGGRLEEVAPRLSPGAAVAQDLVVYDIQSPGSPGWVRIWALRASRLPVRMRVLDPTDGACDEAVFTYGVEPGEGFFDPDAFERRLADPTVPARALASVDLVGLAGRGRLPQGLDAPRARMVTAPTLDGRPWSLGDRLGKVTVLQVWVPSEGGPQGIMHDRRELMPLYEAYGRREDFQIVTLAVHPDVDEVRKMRADQQIPWLFLCDGRGWGGELAEALGGPQHTTLYLVDRQGWIRPLRDPRLVDLYMEGLTYETAALVPMVLSSDLQAGTMTVERVLRLFGEPDGKTAASPGSGRETWVYVRRREADGGEVRLFVTFSPARGVATGAGLRHSPPNCNN